ncbi:MAG: hypothetical protein RSB10_00495 [Clostridia bacterium]
MKNKFLFISILALLIFNSCGAVTIAQGLGETIATNMAFAQSFNDTSSNDNTHSQLFNETNSIDGNLSQVNNETNSSDIALPQATATRANGYPEITHLFTHALIAFPQLAFAQGNEMSPHYDKDCLTAREFSAILASLYARNYILVSPSDIYSVVGGTVIRKKCDFDGKKPLLLSFDDINYYSTKMNRGMNDKLVVDIDGNIATYTAGARKKINYDNEVITIVESFVKKYPSFSYRNAKGVICLTGFDGILGYRTQSGSADRANEIGRAQFVVKTLKEKNWKFACHSYGHYHTQKISAQKFASDTDKWLREVSPIIGKTDIYCFPFGEYDMLENDALSAKQKHLLASGFSMFWGVGDSPFFGKIPFEQSVTEKCSFMDRIPLDGYSLRNIDLSKYFDANTILDPARPR